jgi:rod shape determining protein RodA
MITSAILPTPLARLPWRLLFMIGGICTFGLVVLYSAAGGNFAPWANKQAMVILFFLSIAIVISTIKESTMKALTFPAYAAIVVMLVGVELLGFVTKGAQRWLDLGFIRLQPSEFMKPAIVLTLARFYELLPAGEIRKWRALWPALLMLGVPAGLILVQPDLGTCLMVVFCGVTVLFLAGLPMWYFAGSAVAVAAAMPVAFAMMHEYQRKRVFIFLDP